MTAVFAWCFSHGTMHHFPAGEEPWCTASWVWLAGLTREQAEASKQAAYGDARFLHELPAREQLAIINGQIPDRRTQPQPCCDMPSAAPCEQDDCPGTRKEARDA